MATNEYFGGGLKQKLQQAVPLGTSTVTTQTRTVGVIRRKCRVKAIKFFGNAATTATSLTAEVFARTLAGATGVTLQASATNIDLTQAQLRAGVSASLSATKSNLVLDEGQLLEVTVTASSATAGPGDLTVEVEYEPAP